MYTLKTKIGNPINEELTPHLIVKVQAPIEMVVKCLDGLTHETPNDVIDVVTLYKGQEETILEEGDSIIGSREITCITRHKHDSKLTVFDTIVRSELIRVFKTSVIYGLVKHHTHLEFVTKHKYPIVTDTATGQVTLRDFLDLTKRAEMKDQGVDFSTSVIIVHFAKIFESVEKYVHSKEFLKIAVATLPTKVQRPASLLLATDDYLDGVFGVQQIGDCLRLDFNNILNSTMTISLAQLIADNVMK